LLATREHAKERARQLVTDTPVELWDGPRRIARFDPRPLGVSLRPSVREADERAALVHHQPAAFDGELHARAVKVSVAREDLGRPKVGCP
jgi:hypothetical protein